MANRKPLSKTETTRITPIGQDVPKDGIQVKPGNFEEKAYEVKINPGAIKLSKEDGIGYKIDPKTQIKTSKIQSKINPTSKE